MDLSDLTAELTSVSLLKSDYTGVIQVKACSDATARGASGGKGGGAGGGAVAGGFAT